METVPASSYFNARVKKLWFKTPAKPTANSNSQSVKAVGIINRSRTKIAKAPDMNNNTEYHITITVDGVSFITLIIRKDKALIIEYDKAKPVPINRCSLLYKLTPGFSSSGNMKLGL